MTSPPSRSASEARSPLDIVHVCRVGWPHLGGMESVVGGLASSLARRGHLVRVVTLDRAPGGGDLEPGVWGGVQYIRLPRFGPRSYPAARGLTSHLQRAEIVHVHGLDGLLEQVLASRALHRARVGVTPHGGFLHTSRRWFLKKLWLRTGANAALRRADAVWYTSESSRAALSPAGVEGQVISDGVDVESFSRVVRSPEPGRWLVFGRLDVHKGLESLIDRLAAVAQHDDRPFRLRIVGPETSPGLAAALRKRAVQHGIGHWVHLLGEVTSEALSMELSRCELAFFPSRFEAFGVAVVEAMAAGVPVIVNDIPAFRELVVDGESGVVADFSRSETSRRIRLLRGGLERLSDPARLASQRYGWSERVIAWEAAYRDLLERP